MATRGKMTDMEKEKRADRREAKRQAPCPHDWEDFDGTGALYTCRICPKVTDGKRVWVGE